MHFILQTWREDSRGKVAPLPDSLQTHPSVLIQATSQAAQNPVQVGGTIGRPCLALPIAADVEWFGKVGCPSHHHQCQINLVLGLSPVSPPPSPPPTPRSPHTSLAPWTPSQRSSQTGSRIFLSSPAWPRPCQAGLPCRMLQPRHTNAATLAGCTFNQCTLFTELNDGGRGRMAPPLDGSQVL